MGQGRRRDGRADLWTSRADILANMGFVQWSPGVPMVVEVERLVLKPDDPMQARILRGLELDPANAYLRATFFRRPGGMPWPLQAAHWGGRYVEPIGADGPYYLLTRNFTPFNYRNPFKPEYWNEREDIGFGLAVGLLADAIAGRPGPSKPIR